MNDEEIQNKGSSIASLLQLAAHSSYDDFLHGNESAHMFESVYQRHTPFVINNEQFTMSVDFGGVYTPKLPIKGDFIKDIFIKFKLPDFTINKNHALQMIKWKNNLSNRIIKSFSVKMNNIDIFSFDSVYAVISNYLDGYSTYDETSFKVDVNYLNNEYICYIKIPLWNKTNMRQFFPIGTMYNSELKMCFEIEDRSRLLMISHGFYRISNSDSVINVHNIDHNVYSNSDYSSDIYKNLYVEILNDIDPVNSNKSNVRFWTFTYKDHAYKLIQGKLSSNSSPVYFVQTEDSIEEYNIIPDKTYESFYIKNVSNNAYIKSVNMSNVTWSDQPQYLFFEKTNHLFRSSFDPNSVSHKVYDFTSNELNDLQSIRYDHWPGDFMAHSFIPQGLSVSNNYVYVSAYSQSVDNYKPRIYRFNMNHPDISTYNIDTINLSNVCASYITLGDQVNNAHVGGLVVIDSKIYVSYQDDTQSGIGIYSFYDDDFSNTNTLYKTVIYTNSQLESTTDPFTQNGPSFLGISRDESIIWYGKFDSTKYSYIRSVPVDGNTLILNQIKSFTLPITKVQGCVKPFANKPLLYLVQSYGNRPSQIFEWNYSTNESHMLDYTFPAGLEGIDYTSDTSILNNNFQRTHFYCVSEGGSSYYQNLWIGNQTPCICKFNKSIEPVYRSVNYLNTNFASINAKLIYPAVNGATVKIFRKDHLNHNLLAGFPDITTNENGEIYIPLDYLKSVLPYNHVKNTLDSDGETFRTYTNIPDGFSSDEDGFLIEFHGGTNTDSSNYPNLIVLKADITLQNCWTEKNIVVDITSTLYAGQHLFQNYALHNSDYIHNLNSNKIIESSFLLVVYNLLIDTYTYFSQDIVESCILNKFNTSSIPPNLNTFKSIFHSDHIFPYQNKVTVNAADYYENTIFYEIINQRNIVHIYTDAKQFSDEIKVTLNGSEYYDNTHYYELVNSRNILDIVDQYLFNFILNEVYRLRIDLKSAVPDKARYIAYKAYSYKNDLPILYSLSNQELYPHTFIYQN